MSSVALRHGSALAEVHASLLDRLKSQPYANQWTLLDGPSPLGDDLFHIHFTSPLLSKDCRGHQEIWIEGDFVRCKPWADT